MRVRGGYQLATRAPNTEELFAGRTSEHGQRLHLRRSVPGVDDGDLGQPAGEPMGRPHANPNTPAGAGPLPAAHQPQRHESGERQPVGVRHQRRSAPELPRHRPERFRAARSAVLPDRERGAARQPDLGVEEAKTWTLGVVFNGPGSLENLTASVDFYNIEITDAIATLDATFVYSKCFNADGVSNPTYSLQRSGRLLQSDHARSEHRRAVARRRAVPELGQARRRRASTSR